MRLLLDYNDSTWHASATTVAMTSIAMTFYRIAPVTMPVTTPLVQHHSSGSTSIDSTLSTSCCHVLSTPISCYLLVIQGGLKLGCLIGLITHYIGTRYWDAILGQGQMLGKANVITSFCTNCIHISSTNNN